MQLQQRHKQDLETYLKNVGLKPITYQKHLLYFQHFNDMFNGFITQKTIDSFLSQKTSPNHRAMINHLINLLKRDNELSQDEQLEISRMVILKKLGRKDTKPIAILTKEEIKRLVEKCRLIDDFSTERFKLMVLWQYTSGLRINELCNLRWEHLKYQGRTRFYEEERDKLKYQKLYITSDIAKGGKASDFYVRTDVYLAYFDFLKKWKNISSQVVYRIMTNQKAIWGRNKKKYSRDFNLQIFKALGFKLPDNTSTHILRHSIATHLLMDGMTLLEVKDFMRHSSVKETERYLHLAKDLVAKSLEKIGNSTKIDSNDSNIKDNEDSLK